MGRYIVITNYGIWKAIIRKERGKKKREIIIKRIDKKRKRDKEIIREKLIRKGEQGKGWI
jgi:hypothetical protein